MSKDIPRNRATFIAGPFPTIQEGHVAAVDWSASREVWLLEGETGFQVWTGFPEVERLRLVGRFYDRKPVTEAEEERLVAVVILRDRSGRDAVKIRATGLRSMDQARAYGGNLSAEFSRSEGRELYLWKVSLSNGEIEVLPAPSFWAEGVRVLSIETNGTNENESENHETKG